MSVTKQAIKSIRSENLALPFVNEPLNFGSKKTSFRSPPFQNKFNCLKKALALACVTPMSRDNLDIFIYMRRFMT